jgi:hypothetical protein
MAWRGVRLTSNDRRHSTTPHMSPLFKKLNLGALSVIHVLNAPESFETELAALEGVTIKRSVSGRCGFAMAFVTTQAELDIASAKLAKACEGDAVLWMVYPKGTSRKYKCEFNRDSGWPALGAAGFEPVRMVAVDADWSALRFRRAQYIKTMVRKAGSAISEAGKRKASANDA